MVIRTYTTKKIISIAIHLFSACICKLMDRREKLRGKKKTMTDSNLYKKRGDARERKKRGKERKKERVSE